MISIHPLMISILLISLEVFFDSDPGLGNGIEFNSEENESSTVQIEIPSNLENGLHVLFIRSINSDWQESSVQSFPFVINKEPEFEISNYSIDVVLNGNNEIFTINDILNDELYYFSLPITPELANGLHSIHFMTEGLENASQSTYFIKTNTPPEIELNSISVYINQTDSMIWNYANINETDYSLVQETFPQNYFEFGLHNLIVVPESNSISIPQNYYFVYGDDDFNSTLFSANLFFNPTSNTDYYSFQISNIIEDSLTTIYLELNSFADGDNTIGIMGIDQQGFNGGVQFVEFNTDSLTIFGCTDTLAFNYYPNANLDDDSCQYLGDCNFDGMIDVNDIVLIVQGILEIIELDEIQWTLADYNQDGEANISDIVQIVNLILGLDSQIDISIEKRKQSTIY